MKDQQAIKKLQLLKTMQPSKKALKGIKEGVYHQIQPETKMRTFFSTHDRFRSPASLQFYRVAFYAGAFAFLLIMFLFASTIFFPNQIHNAFLYGRLAFASNQYQKAQIALTDTKSRFADNKSAQENINELAYSLTVTNTQLTELKLKGEKGKYTAQECHQIYQEYLIYLESKEKVISSHNSTLKSQINSYEEQAERKLHMYNSL